MPSGRNEVLHAAVIGAGTIGGRAAVTSAGF